MVPLSLKIDPSFFEEENRNGYVVSSDMKKVWAVELDLLNAFSRVCEQHGLKWFVHAGTSGGLEKYVKRYGKHLLYKYVCRKKRDYLNYLNQCDALLQSYNDQDTECVGESINMEKRMGTRSEDGPV